MVGASGFEPESFCTPSKRATSLRYAPKGVLISGGGKGSRTPDLLNAIQALYQLSYTPTWPLKAKNRVI